MRMYTAYVNELFAVIWYSVFVSLSCMTPANELEEFRTGGKKYFLPNIYIVYISNIKQSPGHIAWCWFIS